MDQRVSRLHELTVRVDMDVSRVCLCGTDHVIAHSDYNAHVVCFISQKR